MCVGRDTRGVFLDVLNIESYFFSFHSLLCPTLSFSKLLLTTNTSRDGEREPRRNTSRSTIAFLHSVSYSSATSVVTQQLKWRICEGAVNLRATLWCCTVITQQMATVVYPMFSLWVSQSTSVLWSREVFIASTSQMKAWRVRQS